MLIHIVIANPIHFVKKKIGNKGFRAKINKLIHRVSNLIVSLSDSIVIQ